MAAREIILSLYPDLGAAANLDGCISTAGLQIAAGLPNRDTGVAFLALHYMGVTKAPMGTAGGVLSAKAGGVARTYGAGKGDGPHGSTMWGREFDNWMYSTICGMPAKEPGWILY